MMIFKALVLISSNPDVAVRCELDVVDRFAGEQVDTGLFDSDRLVRHVRMQDERLVPARPLDREHAFVDRLERLRRIRREGWMRPAHVQLSEDAGEDVQPVRVRLQLLDERVAVDRCRDTEERPIVDGRDALEREQDAVGGEKHVRARRASPGATASSV